MSNEEKILISLIYEKYNKMTLSKKECSEVVGRSCSSLDRDRRQGIGIVAQHEENGNIYYPIQNIVSWMVHGSTRQF